jgi:pimeloyl-ACP methyl ester carboxylesterase
VDRMMVVDVPLDIQSVASRLRSPASPSDLADWLLGRDLTAGAARSDALKTDLQAITRSFDSLSETNFMSFLDGMSTPCLIAHGQNDPAVQTPEYERILAMTDRVHQIVLENCGHFPMLDEGPTFNRLMADFLALLSGESPRELQLKDEWKRRVR